MRSHLLAMLAAASVASGLLACPDPAGAASVELPVRGPFGDSLKSGCRSARAQEEGAYVVFKAQGVTEEGGEAGCAYAKVERVSQSNYLLTGACRESEAKPRDKRSTLIVVGENEIVYNGLRLLRCN